MLCQGCAHTHARGVLLGTLVQLVTESGRCRHIVSLAYRLPDIEDKMQFAYGANTSLAPPPPQAPQTHVEHDVWSMCDSLLTRPTHPGSMANMGLVFITILTDTVAGNRPITAIEPKWVGLVSRISPMNRGSCSSQERCKVCSSTANNMRILYVVRQVVRMQCELFWQRPESVASSVCVPSKFRPDGLRHSYGVASHRHIRGGGVKLQAPPNAIPGTQLRNHMYAPPRH